MESTRKYWIPIYNILEATCNIVLAHPKYVRLSGERKWTRRMPSELRTFSSTTWFLATLSLHRISASFGTWYITAGYSPTSLLGKKPAQNCLTVSNIKLDDVFSDIFGKAASAITSRLLGCLTEKISDVSSFHTKGMKAIDEQVLSSVDGEMCVEQAEKFHIIRSHMDSLELCKLNLESLILSAVKKYLP